MPADSKADNEIGMLAWLRYRYQLYRLQLKRRFAVGKKGRIDELEVLKTIRTFDEEICILMTWYLIGTAEKLMIETPHPSPPNWREAEFHSHRVYLTEASIFKLRAAIRTERKERSELARSWLSSITGLIGVLIGLLAIILGHR